ncbi:alpha/beta fold hydrolase [Thermomonospora umbrina]|uniref:Pimeloyl-ACP methyl ester carboxylesterase n=1 Tax=Thermomonospora umbrina TaxID=111806 RepID=A0A3D9T385_9ACTN|nr:alpha/beta hydrolase [Thermomonospora umbrina]REE98271.1 pimeloyl-ACP methyl ester carboxylesterase [Thermomonospora umbrina]
MPQITLRQGTIRYREAGVGEPIVFLHGYVMDGRLWDRVVERLAGRFRCITLDLPLGAHTIPMAPEADLGLRGLGALVAEALEALDLHDVTLVGNDSGDAIAQVVAAWHPERLARLVLTPGDCLDNCPPTPFKPLVPAARVPALVTMGIRTQRLRFMRRLPLGYGLLTNGPLPHDLITDWIRAFRGHAGVRRDTIKVTRGLNPHVTREAALRLASFTKPTLLAFAPDDRLFPFAHAELLAAILPNARVERIEDSLTWVMLDQPERTARLIRDFVLATPGTSDTPDAAAGVRT